MIYGDQHNWESTDLATVTAGSSAQFAGGTPQADEGEPLGRALARRWRAMLLVTCLCGAASLAPIWMLVKPKFEVAATIKVKPVVRPILVSDQDTDISRWYGVYVATEMRAMTSPAVIGEAIALPEISALETVRNSRTPVADIASQLTAFQVKGTTMVQLLMTGEHPRDMAAIVNAILQTYLRRFENQEREWDEMILASLKGEKTQLESELIAKAANMRSSAVGNGLGGADDSRTLAANWMTELRTLLTESKRRRAIAAAELQTLEADADKPNAIIAPERFEVFIRSDTELSTLKEQLRTLKLSTLSDEREGRGQHHPKVQGRAEMMEVLTAQILGRTSHLRDMFAASERHRLQTVLRDAEVAEQLYAAELDRLASQREGLATQKFDLDDMLHERERLEVALNQVRQKIWNVQVEQKRGARITIDSLAMAPELPNIDKRPKYSAAAMAMSLFLGGCVALLRHRLDHSLRSPHEITEQLGVRLLGSVAQIPGAAAAGHNHDHRMIEPIRGISTALLVHAGSRTTRTRLVTGPTPGTGKSTLAANLARSLASTGRHVLLIDGDNHGRGVSRRLELLDRPGLLELLLGTIAPKDAICSSKWKNLDVMPAGACDQRFGESLDNAEAQQRLSALFAGYDEVIIDSPPVLATSDAVVLTTLVDEVVLVLRAGRSTREEARVAQQRLSVVGGKMVGVILNAVEAKSSYVGYGYGYGYGQTYVGAEER